MFPFKGLIDEPAGIGITTFAANGEVSMTITAARRQFSSRRFEQTRLQLIQRPQVHSDACEHAVAEGKGGARF